MSSVEIFSEMNKRASPFIRDLRVPKQEVSCCDARLQDQRKDWHFFENFPIFFLAEHTLRENLVQLLLYTKGNKKQSIIAFDTCFLLIEDRVQQLFITLMIYKETLKI